MRDFFKQILSNLYIYAGNRQIEKMSDDEIKLLLDALVRMSKIYSYIPEDKQKEIILTCLVSDREYQNINVRTVSKWLEQNGKTYFKEVAHQQNQQPENYKPLEGAERDAMLTMWHNALKQMNESFTEATKPKGGGEKMREQLDEAGVKIDQEKHREYLSHPPKSFIIEGLEIFAKSEADAQIIYNETVHQQAKEPDKT